MSGTSAEFDTSAYPRAYGYSPGWKLFTVGFGALLSVGGVAWLVDLLFVHPLPITPTLWISALTVLLGCVGAAAALSALKSRVVLTVEGVEVVDLLRRRRLLCSQIRGRRLRKDQGPGILLLVPKADSDRQLKISLAFKRDAAFVAWLEQFPDLDREELARSERQIAATVYLDQAPLYRAASIERLRRTAVYLHGITMALCVAALFLRSYAYLITTVLVALPWVAVWLVARFQPLYRFGGKRNDAHPDLSLPLVIPGMVLFIYARRVAWALDLTESLLLTLCVGLTLGVAALWADPWLRQQRGVAAFTCLFLLSYGYGAGFEINVLADSTKPAIYPAPVLDKRASRSSKSTAYSLVVGPWGPKTIPQEIYVTAALFNATRIGDKVCVYVGEGALKVRWYQIGAC